VAQEHTLLDNYNAEKLALISTRSDKFGRPWVGN